MKTNKKCIHCGKPIVYDRSVHMWKSQSGYYCVKDPNFEICQHKPKQ